MCLWRLECIRLQILLIVLVRDLLQDSFWALSLVGRAPALHAGGQGFDSPRVQILFNGEMAERSIASDCKSDASRLRRFKSYSPQMDFFQKVPIVQWIEQQPSKLWIQVRSLVGIGCVSLGGIN